MTTLHVFAVSVRPSAGHFKSPTTFWTSKNLPLHWEKPPAKTSLNKKLRIPPSSVSNAHINRQRTFRKSDRRIGHLRRQSVAAARNRRVPRLPPCLNCFHESQIAEEAARSPRRRTRSRRIPPKSPSHDPRRRSERRRR